MPTPSEPLTHHCDYCSRDIVAEYDDDEFGMTSTARCPHCGASSNDYQHEFHIDEPWVKDLEPPRLDRYNFLSGVCIDMGTECF